MSQWSIRTSARRSHSRASIPPYTRLCKNPIIGEPFAFARKRPAILTPSRNSFIGAPFAFVLRASIRAPHAFAKSVRRRVVRIRTPRKHPTIHTPLQKSDHRRVVRIRTPRKRPRPSRLCKNPHVGAPFTRAHEPAEHPRILCIPAPRASIRAPHAFAKSARRRALHACA